MKARSVGLVLAVTLLASSSARASCIRTSCFCIDDTSAKGTLEASITSVAGARTEFQVETVRGTAGGFVQGGTLTLPRENEDVAGQRWLLFFADDAFRSRLLLTNGEVSCVGSSPVLVLPAQEADQLFSRPDCPDAIDARGYDQVCNDVVCGCSGGGLPLLGLALVGLLRVTARLRRRSPSPR